MVETPIKKESKVKGAAKDWTKQQTMLSHNEHELIHSIANTIEMGTYDTKELKNHIMCGSFNAQRFTLIVQKNCPKGTNKAVDAICELARAHVKSERNWELSQTAGYRTVNIDWGNSTDTGAPGLGQQWGGGGGYEGGKGGQGGKVGKGRGRGGGGGKGGDGKGGGKGQQGKGGRGKGKGGKGYEAF